MNIELITKRCVHGALGVGGRSANEHRTINILGDAFVVEQKVGSMGIMA